MQRLDSYQQRLFIISSCAPLDVSHVRAVLRDLKGARLQKVMQEKR
jgi:hypothetical protein